ncbi:MAG: hypothetical protein KDK64_02210 [Chlamydiia bacterium]|nr:hypothetical protein [Chlamydiia bacterium]
MNDRLLKLLLLFCLPLALFGRQRTYDHLEPTHPAYVPWFTGTLLPPSAVNASPGHPILAPFVSFTVTYGEYDDNWNFKGTPNTWAINPYLEYLFGINDHIGVDIYASFISNFKKGQSSTHLQDTTLLLGFQIARDTPNTWIPDIRLLLEELVPTGNYQKLDPKKLGTDATGQGSFQTGFNLIVQKLFPINNNYLLLKWTLAYLFPAPVHVKGLNAYGGGKGTSGKVFPGQTLFFYFSGEYSLTQRWVVGFDSLFEYQQKTPFSGNPGHMLDGTPLPIGRGPLVQLTLSPQVEYNLSSTSGFLFALWATVLGRNSSAFATAVAAYYICF